jgi:hypothetical protein
VSRYYPPVSDDNFDECAADEERRQRALGIHPLCEPCPECGGPGKEYPDRYVCSKCGQEWFFAVLSKKKQKSHHIRRKDGVWEIFWGKELAAASPHSILDAWEKACDWHGRMAAEAWHEVRRLAAPRR